MDRRHAGALLALAACIACSAAAPTASNLTALDLYDDAPQGGCYYNFQHYGEGDRIMTNEPCLNCTCHNRMLMCYLRVCPFTKPIGQDCTIEKRADQCCPIVTCPDVPVDLLTSTSTTSPAEYGATGLEKLTKYGCSINGKYLPEGSKVPPTPNKPCEHCYCIRNMTTCVMQECTLHVDGCTPIYHKDVCCPVRYSCDHPEDEMLLLDDMSTTVRPTPGYLLTTTTLSPVTQMSQDCVHDEKTYADGALIKTEKACEHCYCMKGDIVCVVQECGTPMENEGKNCTSLPPREGQCCPDTYICESDEVTTELPTELTTDSKFEFGMTTIKLPQRGGVEGSGYRNEPDGIPTVQPEHEGSGEEQLTMVPYETAEKQTPETEKSYIEPYTTQSTLTSEAEDTDRIPTGILETQTTGMTHVPPEQEHVIITTEREELISREQSTTTKKELETYDGVTVVPEEDHNAVPDSILEDNEPHKYIPTTTSKEEIEGTTPSVSEENIQTGDTYEEETTKAEYSYTTQSISSVEISQPTKENDLTIHDTTSYKEISETEQYVPSTPGISTIDDLEIISPETHEGVTFVDITDRKEDTDSKIYVSSTTSVPSEKGDKTTEEPDHLQNTVAEEDYIHPHIHTTTTNTLLKVEEETTLFSTELGSGEEDTTEENLLEPYDHTATLSPEKESKITTLETDEKLSTTPGKISEETTSSTLSEGTTLSQEREVTEPDNTRRTDSKSEITTKPFTLSTEFSASRGDHITVTTEPSFRKEDKIEISTEKSSSPEDIYLTTGKIDFTEEGFIPTSIHEKRPSDSPSIATSIEQEFTTLLPDNIIESKETTIHPNIEFTRFPTIPGKLPQYPVEHSSEFMFSTPTTERISDITTMLEEVEAHEEPGRIPGEGNCLLNGVTYRNNSVVPSTNNCHTGCKCVSSIIKCDPIICSPTPDYMYNCQSIYDSPDSCCPTYVCDHPRETVPPQSDNQMSGTESPLTSPSIECRGDQCELNINIKQPVQYDSTSTLYSTPSDKSECGLEGCGSKTEKPVDSQKPEICKDNQCTPPVQDCTDGKCEKPTKHDAICNSEHGCQAVPVKPCKDEDCKDTSVDDSLQPTKPCNNEDDCKKITHCEGDSCKFEVSYPHDTQEVPCKEEECTSDQNTLQECTEESCKVNEVINVQHKPLSQCKDDECTEEILTLPIEDIHHSSTEIPVREQTSFTESTEKTEPSLEKQTKRPVTTITEQQPDIYDTHKDTMTVLPDDTSYTISNEIVTESEFPKKEINISDEKRTTLLESFSTEDQVALYTTEHDISPVTERDSSKIDESEKIETDSQEPEFDIEFTQTTDKNKLYAEHITELHSLVTETGDIHQVSVVSTEASVHSDKSDEFPSTENQREVSDSIAYTTISYMTEPEKTTFVHNVTKSVEFGTQTTLLPVEYESSTTMSLSTESIYPKQDISTHLPEEVIKTSTPKSEKIPIEPSITHIPKVEGEATVGIDSSTEIHYSKAPETMFTPSEDTTDEEFGYTNAPEYELSDTKQQDIEPIKIEPQEGTTSKSQMSPSATEESFIQHTEIPEHIPEKVQQTTKLPIEITQPHEVSDSKQPETSVTDEIQYSEQQKQPVTELETEVSEYMTKVPLTTTVEPVRDFTKIEHAFVTDQDQFTTKSMMQPDAEVTEATDYFNKPTESIEQATEEIHEVTEMTLEPSDKPLYSDSFFVGITEPQEIATGTTEQDIGTKHPAMPERETSVIEVIEKEKPTTEASIQKSTKIDTSKKSPEHENPDVEEKDRITTLVTEKEILDTEYLSTESQQFITKEPFTQTVTEPAQFGTKVTSEPTEQKEEITEVAKSTLSHETYTELPIEEVSSQGITNILESQDIQVHLNTIVPDEFKTEQQISTKMPQGEYSNISESHVTESYKNEIQDMSEKPQESDLKTTADVPRSSTVSEYYPTSEIVTVSSELSSEKQTPIDEQKLSTDSVLTIGIGTVSQITTKAPESLVTKQEEIQTESHVPYEKELEVTEHDKKITETPEKQSETEVYLEAEHITKIPEYVTELSVSSDSITKVPEDVQESESDVIRQSEVTKMPTYTEEAKSTTAEQKEEVTKAPEESEKIHEEVTEENKITEIPEYIDTEKDVTIPNDIVTKAPEISTISKQEVTRRQDQITDAPESEFGVTPQEDNITATLDESEQVAGEPKVPEDTKESISETSHENITKTPETTIVSELHVTRQEETTTEAIVDIQQSEEVKGIREQETKTPEETKEIVPDVTAQQDKVTKIPEDLETSTSVYTEHEEEVTKTDNIQDLQSEITDSQGETIKVSDMPKEPSSVVTQPEEKVTESPEDIEELLPEVLKHEEIVTVTKTPEETKETLPEILDKDVTKVPEDTKESLPHTTTFEEETTRAPEGTKESILEITKYVEETTETSMVTKESPLDITKYAEEVTKIPEDKDALELDITSQDDETTKAPSDTKEPLPEKGGNKEEISGLEEGLSQIPEDSKQSLPEFTDKEKEVAVSLETENGTTKGPIESKPEVSGQIEDITKHPEDSKDSLPEVTTQEEAVTKTFDHTKEPFSEVTEKNEMTETPDSIKDSLAVITRHEEEVTKAPEYPKDTLPENTESEVEVTTSPEKYDMTKPLIEITTQEEQVTETHKKVSLSEAIGEVESMTKAPEDTKESIPEKTTQAEALTEAPTRTTYRLPEITEQDEDMTKYPEETKESQPVDFRQDEGITKTPEESLSEVTRRKEEQITVMPFDSLPQITVHDEEITKMPEVSQASEHSKEPESKPEITDKESVTVVTERQETTPLLYETNISTQDVGIKYPYNELPEQTTAKQIEDFTTEQPGVIILEEHTHKIIEDISTSSISHDDHTVTEVPGLELITAKPTDEHSGILIPEAQSTAKDTEELFTSSELPIFQTTSGLLEHVTKHDTETSMASEEISTDHKYDEVDKETTLSPVLVDSTPVIHVDLEKSPIPDAELPIQTEKTPSDTEKPVQHEVVPETTSLQDEFTITTTKATIIKQDEEPIHEKPIKTEDKPIETSVPESPKPIPSEPQPTDELPVSEEDGHFPPSAMGGYGEPDYVEEDQAFGPGTCRYGGKVYVSAQQIPRDDPCDFCFCFRSDIICLQQSCPPPIHGCHEEPIQGFCCPRYECPVSMATMINVTTTTTTTTTTLPPHFPTHSYKGAAQRRGCQIKGHTYKVGEVVRSSSGPCLHCTCGGDGQMKCDPKACTPEPMLRQMIAAAVSARRRR